MCCKCKGREIECYISLTIEKKLKAYSECPDHTQRHEILWHEWNHNKRWLIQLQELILPSFPSYSRHDVSHSEAVIHNIEMLLGEKNIMELSATDCFVLLHTVFIHDIGMCITHADREEILANSKFKEFVDVMAGEADSDMGKYARVLLQEDFRGDDLDDEASVLKKKLDVYYAIIYLIAEHRRREHGEVSEKRLISWIDAPDKLGIGFSTIDIPSRLFYIIAHCASSHTKWDFNEVLKLKQEDSGFALDYVHPRFVAVLLQLGDALDMDNNRFHPLTEEFLGRIPQQSTVHWNKHKAIKRLRITNEKISISADCKNQEELRVVRMECDGIQSILKNATFYWSVIRPKNSNVGLPTLDQVDLLLQGEQISIDLVTAQFEISQEKAFNLLMGNNIYSDHNFVFLRELIQNAVDATKIEYFREYQRRMKAKVNGRKIREDYGKAEKALLQLTPAEISEVVLPEEHSIEIGLAVRKRCYTKDEIQYLEISQEDIKNPDKAQETEYGVLVQVRDYGIGIDEQDIKQISAIGSSYESRKDEIKRMPKWLQPTGTFGIGLQSVFLVGSVLTAYTHAMNSKSYEITFYPRKEGKRGYINVKPRDVDDTTEPFGSCFEVFVPYDRKKLHKDNPETWDGSDPFQEGYEESKAVRHSRELLKQMALYIASIVGEPIFPVDLEIEDCEVEAKVKEYYDDSFSSAFDRIGMFVYDRDGKECAKSNPQQNVTWLYNLSKSEDTYLDEASKNIYRLDCNEGKLYLWNQQYNTYACVGINRILNMRDKINATDDDLKNKDGVDIYYKGVLMTSVEFKEDANLIEYMDIKDTILKEDLKLNRNGFSKKGYEYLEVVYREIVKTARQALKHYGKNGTNSVKKLQGNIKKLIEKVEDNQNDKARELQLEKLMLSAAALIYFAMVDEKGETDFRSDASGHDCWGNMLEMIIKDKLWTKMYHQRHSSLYNIPLGRTGKEGDQDNLNISIFEVIDRKNKYMVVAQRDNDNHWRQKLVKANDIHGKIKEKIQRLRIENAIDERMRLISEIEAEVRKLGKPLVENNEFFNPNDNYSTDYLRQQKEQQIVKWILDNIPTMAVFSLNSGKVRINLLDVDICDSVYYDLETKQAIVERIIEKTKQANRFTVPVISGFSMLSLKERRESIMFIKRGRLSKIGYGELIFPLTGQQLKDELSANIEVYKYLETKIETISEIGENTLYKAAEYLKNSDIENESRFIQNIGKFLNMPHQKHDCEIQAYNENILERIEAACQDAKETEVWDTYLAPVVWYIQNECRADRVENELAEKLYQKYCAHNVVFKNIKENIRVHGKMNPSYELIEMTYRRYLYEVAQVIVKIIQKQCWESHKKDKNLATVKNIEAAFRESE